MLAEVEKRKQLGGLWNDFTKVSAYPLRMFDFCSDDIFRRAGISSAVPTYKYDPTKVKENNPPQIRKTSG